MNDSLTKISHGRFLVDKVELMPLDRLKPAVLNDAVYKPVDPSDPNVIALANSIVEHGLLEPFVVTLDEMLISGHRRRVGCQLAGLKVVPVRRIHIHSSDPDYGTNGPRAGSKNTATCGRN